jgi:prepilin signal peptidase PulO-like enzyme (type II secretory pathway)
MDYSYIPFFRLFKEDMSKQVPLRRILPEVIFILGAFASIFWWPLSTQDLLGKLILATWLVIFLLLVSLMLVNYKTTLLANILVYPIAIISVMYSVLVSIQADNIYYFLGGVVGGLLIASVPYFLFLKTGDKIIGYGNVKTAVVAGIILGFKQAMLCFVIILAMFGVVLLIKLARGTYSKKERIIQRNEVGIMWAVSITVCVLFGERLLNAIL